MEIKDQNFIKVKEEAEEYYKSVESVVCPYFGEDDPVAFNAKGIKHIKFKHEGVARTRADQYMRLKHIRFAQRILEKSKTLQEYNEKKVFEEVKSNKRKEKVMQNAKYYGFVAIVIDKGKMKRLKVVVKQVGNGGKYFWSIIPSWKSNKQLQMHSGDMETD